MSNGQGSGNMSAAPRTTSLYPNIYQPNASFVDSAASSRFEMCNISSSFGIYSTGFAQVNSCTVSESTVYTGQVNQMEQVQYGVVVVYCIEIYGFCKNYTRLCLIYVVIQIHCQ